MESGNKVTELSFHDEESYMELQPNVKIYNKTEEELKEIIEKVWEDHRPKFEKHWEGIVLYGNYQGLLAEHLEEIFNNKK